MTMIKSVEARADKANARIAQIDQRNSEAMERIKAFRAEDAGRPIDRKDLARRQQAAPFFGLVPCRAAGFDFVMFHAHDDVVAREYLWRGEDGYEFEIVRTWVDWCRTPGVVLDIGGYSGCMSILAARAHPDNDVHLFEPVERTVERANVNVKLNGLGRRIRRHAVAASDTPGTQTICLYRDADFLGTGNSIDAKAGLEVVDTATIRTVRIDDHLPGLRPRAVKIDVEGHELACLKGMEATLRRAEPRMIIEVWEETRADVLAFLSGLGYRARRVEQVARGVENYVATVPRRD